ncbi:hypothetical protein KVF89_20835 [Nocardioides carbamazepini]|nr:hypothetical protein [Nocardioides carbamazepini]
MLPSDWGDAASVALLTDLTNKIESFGGQPSEDGMRTAQEIASKSVFLVGPLADAAARYAERATDALTEIDPRTVVNFAHIEGALRRVLGNQVMAEQGWRREIWTLCVGASGRKRGGLQLRHFMQATLDYRIVALIRGWLGHNGPVSAQDHDYLIPLRARFAWASLDIAHLLVAGSGLPVDLNNALEDLHRYTHEACNGQAWMVGRLGTIPLSSIGRELASNLSTPPGALAGTSYEQLLTTRRSETHPFSVVDGIVVPARPEAAQMRIESAIFAYIRRETNQNTAALAMEYATRVVLSEVPGMDVHQGPVHIRVDGNNPGETDLFASGPSGDVLLGEVKSHVTIEGEATTDESYQRGIGHMVAQLEKRRIAYERGEEIHLMDGTVLERRFRERPAILGVTLHEYSGALWRAAAASGTVQAAPLLTPVLAVVDLQIVVAAMTDARDFFTYLDLRRRLFRQGMAHACDELDILCWYLRGGAIACSEDLDRAEGRHAILMSAKDVPIPEQVGPAPDSSVEWRARLLALPHVDGWPHGAGA